MAEALSQREFDTWREGDEAFKAEMRQLLRDHASLHVSTEGRLSTLEATQEKTNQKAVARIAGMASIISAFVGGLFGWLAK